MPDDKFHPYQIANDQDAEGKSERPIAAPDAAPTA
jgi:hypothetical protein